jgi:hypothetical protein
VDSGTTALDTMFKVCVEPESFIGRHGCGHGAQPSFEDLASLTASKMPKYLKAPTSFPVIGDISDDEEDDHGDGHEEYKMNMSERVITDTASVDVHSLD